METWNQFAVGRLRDKVVILNANCLRGMSEEEALNLAVYLLLLSERPKEEFLKAYDEIVRAS